MNRKPIPVSYTRSKRAEGMKMKHNHNVAAAATMVVGFVATGGWLGAGWDGYAIPRALRKRLAKAGQMRGVMPRAKKIATRMGWNLEAEAQYNFLKDCQYERERLDKLEADQGW